MPIVENRVIEDAAQSAERRRLPDPGPPPWCPECGAPASQALAVPQGPQFPNRQMMGVCRGCGIVAHPDFALDKQPLPFLFHVSDLRQHPAPIAEVAKQVRAALRGVS